MKIIRQNPYEYIDDETFEKMTKKNEKKTGSDKDE
jgi:hypothetical protein